VEPKPPPAAERARPSPPKPRRPADPDREARQLNRRAAAALRQLRLAVDEEPAFLFRP
jgi:hypothetical protein